MSEKQKGYIGRIGNGGAQHVEAPHGKRGEAKDKVVHTGKDLRSGKGK